MNKIFKKFSLFLILVLLASGCARNPTTGEMTASGLMSEEEEAEIGAHAHETMLKQYQVSKNEKLVHYVQEVGQRLVEVSEYATRNFKFTVFESAQVNAFALPGGYIYITTGLLVLLEDEAELAAVLGHEIGHVTGRHLAHSQTRETISGVSMIFLSVLTGEISDFLSPGKDLLLQSYDRGEESEADTLALRYVVQAKYDPNGVIRFLATLQRYDELIAKISGHKKEEDRWSVWSTHPMTSERKAEIAERVAKLDTRSGYRGRMAFLSALEGQVFSLFGADALLKIRLVNAATSDEVDHAMTSIPPIGGRDIWFKLLNGGAMTAPDTIYKTLGY